MNVFDWRGPPFLVFYALFGVALFFFARKLRELTDPAGQRDPTPADDPYLVACLRGGIDEAIRISIVSLVDRKLLVVDGERLRSARHAAQIVRRRIEKAIVTACSASAGLTVSEVVSAAPVREQAKLLDAELAAQGYCVVPRVQPGRLLVYVLCAGVGAWVAAHKLLLAFQRGHHNVVGLHILAFLLLVALLYPVFPRRTTTGDEHIRTLKQLFSRGYRDRENLRSGGESTELVWLSAVFGLSALSVANFPAVTALFPRAGSSSGGSSCGSSSCGSSSCGSSSCGSSSCGGGGCGGCGGGGD